MIGVDLIRGPVGRVLGLIVWMVVFHLLLGSINQWYTQTVDAGVVGSERFERVVIAGSNNSSKAWEGVAAVVDGGFTVSAAAYSPPATAAYKLVNEGGACKLGATDATATSTIGATTWYTPMGSEVQSAAVAGGTTLDNVLVTGCRWEEAGDIWNAGGLSGLIEIILQSAGLAPPMALMFTLGTFGQSFIKKVGAHPILAAVMMAILLLLVATLLNTLMPFLTTAFTAVDGNRFVMFDEGLGNVSVVVKNFFAVVLVSSMLMIAWTAFQYIKGGDALSSSSQRM